MGGSHSHRGRHWRACLPTTSRAWACWATSAACHGRARAARHGRPAFVRRCNGRPALRGMPWAPSALRACPGAQRAQRLAMGAQRASLRPAHRHGPESCPGLHENRGTGKIGCVAPSPPLPADLADRGPSEIKREGGRDESTQAEFADRGSKATRHLQYPAAAFKSPAAILPAGRNCTSRRLHLPADLTNDARSGRGPHRRSNGRGAMPLLARIRLRGAHHNPNKTVASHTSLFNQAMTNCANQRSSSHQVELLLRHRHRRMTQAFGYLKRVIVTPAAYPLVEFLHFDIREHPRKSHCGASAGPSQCFVLIKWIPLSALSLEVDRSTPEGPEGPLSAASPARWRPASPEQLESSPPTTDGFGSGPRAPSSQSFSRGYGSILPTSLAYIVPSLQVAHLGDLMRYEYDRAVHSGPPDFRGRRATDTTRRGGALPLTLPPTEPLLWWAGC
ncbi:hypothetical protein FNV43_RR20969 [Rhamnella rubrinervis]|uniref:Uncharacterized protein n=1 Tax=Rhamnella rubrinervis TaxID=2594499 RepID=A0A8K0E1R8_9ROSA|nr:hypothetical protein FNV43_RR20969 [Rhamnella rubrinervis]